ncbi:hypothetical protein [Natronobacterium gregoryi]|uniref:RelE toxin-related domain-containing protein n=2 Tax=Natronobacterium gregoryi TaxID=44930 RepID=L0AL53_NATGS|nr:hypothetical protein [Natronobacterium gregoryi]AFZ74603.1 hypothetical protein Natgr_3484 [Natronobacterium gregoryi SP2]ELY72575.1 hypothetical protein C490_03263 [Natronobacterium gregoryi SP2]PLK19791.1 hypothetical protein CYV19_12850 [Natronobacterium gregoryi SP2]SFJ30291.1 hypothetical protein SAMN05443661_12121 [Natronobacterium gregoryi]
MSALDRDIESTSPPRYEDLEVSDHAQVRWTERSSRPRLNPAVAWLEAVPIDYPRMSPPAQHARLHEVSEIILLADGHATLVTCIRLEDRPEDEQQYIRSQLNL